MTQGLLAALVDRPEPMVRELPPLPGSRAVRYVQLLCPELHVTDAAASPPATVPPAGPGLADRVAALESEVAEMRAELARLRDALGE